MTFTREHLTVMEAALHRHADACRVMVASLAPASVLAEAYRTEAEHCVQALSAVADARLEVARRERGAK